MTNKASVLGKDWQIASTLTDGDKKKFEALNLEKPLPDFLMSLLLRREIHAENLMDFFEPRIKNLLPDPNSLPDMEQAVTRIAEAIIHQETIAIYSDYDVDGACSAALFLRYFNCFDVPCLLHIPNRMNDGYGVKNHRLQELHEQGATLILCCDSGTGLQLSDDFGCDVIIFDHHQIQDDTQQNYIFVNPMRHDDISGHRNICAATICYLALIGLNRFLRETGGFDSLPDLMKELDLVALATVADVMPLVGLNRSFLVQGLKIINQMNNIGIATLNQKVRDGKKINSTEDISFGIAPYLNAGGRMGESLFATKLLASTTSEQAEIYADKLQKLNKLRLETQNDTLKQIKILVSANGWEKDCFILAGAENLHIGVTGIAAGRLKDQYHVPALVVSYDSQGQGTGSARSVKGIDIAEILTSACQKKILTRAGGHKMAGGFGLRLDAENDFREFLREQLRGKKNLEQESSHLLTIDSLCNIPQVNHMHIYWLEKLSPFGQGNPEPIVAIEKLRVKYHQLVGKQKNHLQVTVENQAGESLRMVMFSADDKIVQTIEQCKNSSQLIDVAGYLRINDYKGRKTIDLQFLDIRLA